MRIISQDGCYDMPYEQVMLRRYKENIYLMNRNFCGVEGIVADPIIAKYSTEEKAIKAMEVCREKYQGFFTKGNCMLDHPKVFRFPADDEI